MSRAVMENEATRLSVKSLQRIYAMIIALAVGEALRRFFISPDDNEFAITGKQVADLPALVAFFVTVVPFFHGMNRHLDDFYVLDSGKQAPAGALFFDFVFFLMESAALFAMASTVTNASALFAVLMILLVIDFVWAAVAWMITRSPAIKWSIINFITSIVLFFFYYQVIFPAEMLFWMLTVIVIARTVVDYWRNWAFYFPTGNKSGDTAPA